MSEPLHFILNNTDNIIDVSKGSVLLDYIRTEQRLTGTKEACKEGECGACTVLIGYIDNFALKYKAVASCLYPVGDIIGKHVLTIEGINSKKLNPIQQAFVDEGATQCGFCTPGFIMSLTGFFINSPELSFEDAIDSVDGNICRCTGYVSIIKAIKSLCKIYSKKLDHRKDRLEQLVNWKILPEYMLEVKTRLEIINENNCNNSDIDDEDIVVAGGTDLFVQKPEMLIDSKLKFISNYPEFKTIKELSGYISIGSGVCIEEIKHNPIINKYFKNINEYLNKVSSTIMRNRATIAGNIVNASPIGDLTIIFIALDSVLTISNNQRKRDIKLKDFFTGYKKYDLKKCEIIEAVSFPVPSINSYFNFDKVSQRKYLDIASCNSAISFKLIDKQFKNVSISAGGVAPYPLYLKESSEYLEGKSLSISHIKEMNKIVGNEISPIDDIRGFKDYKSIVLKNMIYGHFIRLFPEQFSFKDFVK